MSDLERRIGDALTGLREPLPAGSAARFATLLEELARWSRRMNLTAVREPRAMITVHLLDSLAVRPLLKGGTVLDIGTGAGFPGLPLAIAEPGRDFHLIDSNNRKIQFVQHAIALLGLDNVTAVRARAEDYDPGRRFDTVIARAVASLRQLVGIAGHHVGEDGVFLALKGRYLAEELQSIPEPWDCEVRELVVPGLEEGSRHAVLMRRGRSAGGSRDRIR